MRDNMIRRVLKACARQVYLGHKHLERAFVRHVRRAPPRYALEGACEGCGRCCEAPSIATGRLLSGLPVVRGLFLAWQKHVNGFEFVRFERAHRVFVFACTHYDPHTRQCDSYESRPGMCRDYPVVLLDQDLPELFDECTYTLRLEGADALARAIDEDPTLTQEQRDKLKRDLLI